ncbi:hypothetical protein ACJX0J_023473, partial [Zea mays]
MTRCYTMLDLAVKKITIARENAFFVDKEIFCIIMWELLNQKDYLLDKLKDDKDIIRGMVTYTLECVAIHLGKAAMVNEGTDTNIDNIHDDKKLKGMESPTNLYRINRVVIKRALKRV